MNPMDEAIHYFPPHFFRPLSALSLRARRRMYRTFMTSLHPAEQDRILDVGVTPDRRLHDSNFFEALYPYKDRITATSIEDASFLEQLYPGLRFVRTGAAGLPFEDGQFDVVVSFAVLEHVGDRERQRAFVAELLRVGRKLFLTTPNRGFPLELHTLLPFVHWLPQAQHQRLLRRLGMRFWAQTENLNLLTGRELAALFPPDAGVRITGHRLLGLTSNLIAIRG
jgi:SAM-dependent methyltransferase